MASNFRNVLLPVVYLRMQGFVVRLPTNAKKRSCQNSIDALPNKKAVQSCLNFGQKQVVSKKVCPLCGMLYSVSSEVDIKSHNNMCSKVLSLVFCS